MIGNVPVGGKTMDPAMRRNIVCLLGMLCLFGRAEAATPADFLNMTVSTSDGLLRAFADARPGTVITLKPGTYPIRRTELKAHGEPGQPITVRAAALGEAKLVTDDVEALVVSGSDWLFENLEIAGTGPGTDHAFHILGGADRTIIRHNRLRDFNAAVKGNIRDGRFADDVVIEDNLIYNGAVRDTDLPVTPLDIDGGRRWDVRGNFIADFAKAGGNRVSYGAFMKAGSSDGIFERNLVICEWRHKGFTRIGLSFGGGGSEVPEICEDRTCTPKHTNGIIRNNIIMNCPADVGIYVNASRNIKILDNTMINTGGIDIRFPESNAEIRNNILSGRVRERDGGTLKQDNNLSIDSAMTLFADAASGDFRLRDGTAIRDRARAMPEVPDDFCGNPRGHDRTDLGAIGYSGPSCDRARQLLSEASR